MTEKTDLLEKIQKNNEDIERSFPLNGADLIMLTGNNTLLLIALELSEIKDELRKYNQTQQSAMQMAQELVKVVLSKFNPEEEEETKSEPCTLEDMIDEFEALYNPQSKFNNSQSEIDNPQSEINNSQSEI
jgi:hypothetical protein